MSASIPGFQNTRESLSLFTYQGENVIFKHERDIRLLSVQLDHGGRLCCSLRVANLDKTPGFKALSYTWGPAIRTEATKLGGSSGPNKLEVVSHRFFSSMKSFQAFQSDF